MPRYIDADNLEKHFMYCIVECGNTNAYSKDFEIVLHAVQNQPTADVVEVVRCKDCKNACHKTDTTCVCGILDMIMCVEDYCSYGERNEDSK